MFIETARRKLAWKSLWTAIALAAIYMLARLAYGIQPIPASACSVTTFNGAYGTMTLCAQEDK